MSEKARELVDGVIENLLDRRGVGNELEQVDDDVMAELKGTLAGIADAAVAPLVSALERALPYIDVNSKPLDEALEALKGWKQ